MNLRICTVLKRDLRNCGTITLKGILYKAQTELAEFTFHQIGSSMVQLSHHIKARNFLISSSSTNPYHEVMPLPFTLHIFCCNQWPVFDHKVCLCPFLLYS